MITLPSSLAAEIRKLSSSGSIVALLEVQHHADHTLDIRLARDTRNVVWNSRLWTKSWFEVEAVEEVSSSNPPELWVRISNIGGLVEDQIIQRDNLDGDDVAVYFVSSVLLSETTPIFSATFNVMKVQCTRDLVSVKLSAQNPLLLNYPTVQAHGSICQYPKFPTDPRCPYAGALTTCNRTLADCLVRWPFGLVPFGAQLGLAGELQDDNDI